MIASLALVVSLLLVVFGIYVMGTLKPTSQDQIFNGIVSIAVWFGLPLVFMALPFLFSKIAKDW